jgi:hypothetical protein
MKPMAPESSRALTVTAVVLLLLGLLVPSPSGALAAFCLGALTSAVPVLFGRGTARITAAIVLLCALGLAGYHRAAFQADQERYRQRASPGN